MSDLSPYPNSSRRPGDYYAWVIVGICCLALIMWLKTLGVVLSLGIVTAILWGNRIKTNTSENFSLARSIVLSAADITDVIEAFEKNRDSLDTDSIAERTLHRPELYNTNSTIPEVETFYFQLANAQRFLQRIDTHLASAHTTEELESLLKITDRRASEFNQSWIAARRATLRFNRGS